MTGQDVSKNELIFVQIFLVIEIVLEIHYSRLPIFKYPSDASELLRFERLNASCLIEHNNLMIARRLSTHWVSQNSGMLKNAYNSITEQA
ncbi:unnamed protein product [Didymodactylos carnosus]|uniref:Uncharacterized protein n=1 Tax=Didymodactylos carnosus TaxID=1234261 RepID=A0A813RU42_9BILA|nr:unnamed protein product [Didymodactylos carnosus]CAF1092436.1 unnamed protein product [Didymodactylos carnosus]CAF3571581.1 unnamed protein product [Didymodactylos carnosus]CAF3853933.1 unnamed protein product [Didymodactylos carnosus]